MDRNIAITIGGIITLIALFLMGIGFIGVSVLTGDSVEAIGPLILYGFLLLLFVGLPVLIGGAIAIKPIEPEKIKQVNQGGYALVRDTKNIEVIGLWVNYEDIAKDLMKLIMLCTKAVRENNISEVNITKVLIGDYRVVPNNYDNKGGYFVMLGSALAPGETIPSLDTFIWCKGMENPVSNDVSLFLEEKWLKYLCPTCKFPVKIERSKIDPIIGVNIECYYCKNLSHVPGAFGTGTLPSNLKITGGVIVPIKEFYDWYFNHPVVKSLINTNQIELLNQYGLYGWCRKCFHQFESTILTLLPLFHRMESSQISFNANSPESTNDFYSLKSGKCPSCGYNKMIVIITDIPDYVQVAIKRKREKFDSLHEKIDENLEAQKDAQNKYNKLLCKKGLPQSKDRKVINENLEAQNKYKKLLRKKS